MWILAELSQNIRDYDIIKAILSFTTAYFVLYSVSRFGKGDISVLRLIAAALIVTVANSIAEILSGIYCYVFTISTTILALLLAKSDYGLTEFIKIAALYVAVSLTLDAVEESVMSLINSRQVSGFVTIAGVLAIYIMFESARSLAKSKFDRPDRVHVEVSYGQKSLKINGLFDSGNALYRNGTPVAVLSDKIAKKLGIVATGELAVSTVAGIKLLPSAEVEIKLYYDKNSGKEYITPVVISDKMVSRGYDIILHKDTEVV